jgi:hypothetical protein
MGDPWRVSLAADLIEHCFSEDSPVCAPLPFADSSLVRFRPGLPKYQMGAGCSLTKPCRIAGLIARHSVGTQAPALCLSVLFVGFRSKRLHGRQTVRA